VAAQVNSQAKAFPGVRIVTYTRRDYPERSLAAHAVGHVGLRSGIDTQMAVDNDGRDAEQAVGLMGMELSADPRLAGKRGLAVQSRDRRGKVLATRVERSAVAGSDAVLTIDIELQRAAEMFLDEHLRRQRRHAQKAVAAGGAIVILDVHTGEIIAAASAPRFDPNLFVLGDPRVERTLADASRPLVDRVMKMAIPPGSVFKPVTALALVSERCVAPDDTFYCQGYFDEPQRMRCQLFRRQGIGHGDLTLAGALAQSCNVYFFHHARSLGGARLAAWAARGGFGQAAGVELPDEAAGELPSQSTLETDSQAQMFAVGQGSFTATPLQVARLYAAIANGGYLVRPTITRVEVAKLAAPLALVRHSESERIAGLTPEALAAVQHGLLRTVEDRDGTAYATVRLPGISIAGKTGTAESGSERADHAWFAGYAPAEAPRYAFVVALEHAGSGADTAGPIARAIVKRLKDAGHLGDGETARTQFPPGKG
jgi:penicillin-binding protein 2